MPDITVTVRAEDYPTLTELAEQQRRDPDQQAGWMLEQALRTAHAKSDPNAIPRTRRGRARTNGVARIPTEAIV